MGGKTRISALMVAMFVAVLDLQGSASAGRLDFAAGAVESGRGAGLDKAREGPSRTAAVPGPDALVRTDTRIAEYLEMHGRVFDGSARANMMPWSALHQQIAN